MHHLTVLGLLLMAGGAGATYALTSNIDGFTVLPAWKFALGVFLSMNVVILRYLPLPRPPESAPPPEWPPRG